MVIFVEKLFKRLPKNEKYPSIHGSNTNFIEMQEMLLVHNNK